MLIAFLLACTEIEPTGLGTPHPAALQTTLAMPAPALPSEGFALAVYEGDCGSPSTTGGAAVLSAHTRAPGAAWEPAAWRESLSGADVVCPAGDEWRVMAVE